MARKASRRATVGADGAWERAIKYEVVGVSSDAEQQAILEDIRRVARLLGGKSVSLAEFRRHGTTSFRKVVRAFGTWGKAIAAAGLTPLKGSPGYPRTRLGQEDIISEIRRIARLLDRQSLSVAEFEKHASVSEMSVLRAFGTWNAAVQVAGLVPFPNPKATKIPEGELEAEFMRVYNELGKAPTHHEFGKAARFSPTTYISRWGSWRKTVARYLGSEMVGAEPKNQQTMKPANQERGK
ncbi:MAG: hypothetical protein MUP14_02795 [Dehalococcoidia bacterium]|nr:hypothetical protein [Dehalococcoidia bacterium]